MQPKRRNSTNDDTVDETEIETTETRITTDMRDAMMMMMMTRKVEEDAKRKETVKGIVRGTETGIDEIR